jgi:hypothetical protein
MALVWVTLSTAAFETINALASLNSVQVWSFEEENVQREKHHNVKVMDIYDIKMKQCEFHLYDIFGLKLVFSPIICRHTS